MRAVVVDRLMEPEDLRVQEIPEPEATPGHVVVDVKSAGCNFFDILILAGKYQVKPELPFTPGGEFAGVVSALGAGVEGLAIGDPGDSIRTDIERLRSAEILPDGLLVSGYVYDVNNGHLNQVAETASLRESINTRSLLTETEFLRLSTRRRRPR